MPNVGSQWFCVGHLYRCRRTSSKTSSFGGTLAQPYGVALLFLCGRPLIQRRDVTLGSLRKLACCVARRSLRDRCRPTGTAIRTTPVMRRLSHPRLWLAGAPRSAQRLWRVGESAILARRVRAGSRRAKVNNGARDKGGENKSSRVREKFRPHAGI